MKDVTVPLDVRNDMRAMDTDGVARAEIARSLGVSRNTVAKCADTEGKSPAAPLPAHFYVCARPYRREIRGPRRYTSNWSAKHIEKST